MGLCQFTKGVRIKRHDEVKNFLANKLREQNEVFVEPTVITRGNRYEPNFAVKNEVLVDVTVHYEYRNYLLKVSQEKIGKYLPCLEHLKTIYGLKEGSVLPLELGNREVVTTKTKENYKKWD